jgi:hypothetical protein
MAVKPTEVVAVKVRMRERTRRSLADAAKKEGHSLNKEIEKRLERSLNSSTMLELIKQAASLTAKEQSKIVIDRLDTVLGLLARTDRIHKAGEGDDTHD